MHISRNSADTPWPRAASVSVDRERLHVVLKDGRAISVPLKDWFDFLANATDRERQTFEIDRYGVGIWWEELDEGISVPSLFGLPENPPRPSRKSYSIRYRRSGSGWIAEIPDFESDVPAPSISAAKRDGRALLAMLLHVESLDKAGIEVVDEVEDATLVESR
jgi:hypothetical protein